jgi:glycerate-2-kinase
MANTPDASGLRRAHAESIWHAGVAAVDSRRLVLQAIVPATSGIVVCGEPVTLGHRSRVLVVGAGKAGAGMAAGVEDALRGSPWFDRLHGWVNVPADCARPMDRLVLHAARPAGINEPTEEGAAGSARILGLVSALTADDLCLVLLSGGGSALLPAPSPPVSLADKQAVTRALMSAGATIGELNCVRRQLSRIKGGRLAAAAGGASLASLIISDVIGDPLDVIASGPTVPDPSTPAEALSVLERYGSGRRWPETVLDYLAGQVDAGPAQRSVTTTALGKVRNHVIGNNDVALQAAAGAARALGYEVISLGSANAGEAADAGRQLAAYCRDLRDRRAPGVAVCVLSGGEPVVHLAPTTRPRKGGRNQELALAALDALWEEGLQGITILSGGTDGEDGPTDAAGAVADDAVQAAARAAGLHPAPFLEINDSYTFFDRAGGLLRTGPTHTNVMDLRVAIVGEGGVRSFRVTNCAT